MTTTPKTTQAWIYTGRGAPDGRLEDLVTLEERPLPRLGPGQVLIEVEGAPVNPSDLMYLRGTYGVRPEPGAVPGFEGCGTVVAANAGPYGWWLTGRRVAFGGQDGNGTWARHVVTSMFTCIPVRADLPVAAAASLIVNPMTAIAMLDRARRHRARSIVVNAAGSMLGRYLLAAADDAGGPEIVALVRRPETAAELRRAGARHVLVTTSDGFLEEFGAMCRDLDATVLFDAVAGEATAELMGAMPDGTLVVVYGQLSQSGPEGRVALDANALVFRGQRIDGLWLTREIHGLKGAYAPLLWARRIQRLHRSGRFEVPVASTVDLVDLVAEAERYEHGDMNGKVLFRSGVPARQRQAHHALAGR